MTVRQGGSLADEVVVLRNAILLVGVAKDWAKANLLALELIDELGKKGYEITLRKK